MKWTTIVTYSPDLIPVAVILTNGKRFFLAEFFKNKMSLKSSFDQAMEDLMTARYIN